MSKLKHTKELIELAVIESFTYADVMRKLNIRLSGSNSSYIKKRITEFEIDISHFLHRGHHKGSSRTKKADSDILVDSTNALNARRQKAHLLRRAMLNSGVEYRCQLCFVGADWNGKPIILHIDHLNGNGLDNRLDNLRFLCPNCHSQTDNYGAKNRNKQN